MLSVAWRKILSRSRDDLNMDDDYKDYSDHHQDDKSHSPTESKSSVGNDNAKIAHFPIPLNEENIANFTTIQQIDIPIKKEILH